MRDRSSAVVAATFLCALVLLLAADLRNAHVPKEPDNGAAADAWWVFYAPQRVGSDYLALLPYLPNREEWHSRYRTISVGEAARRDAGGPVEDMVAPEELGLLVADDASGVRIDPLFDLHLQRMMANNVRYVSYDPVVDDALIQRWRSDGLVTDYPRSVSLVAGGEGRYVLHADPARELIYVVPAALSPEGGNDGS